ncbi:MAG: transglycosylase domain-containing protein [Anaerotruncus sp.]|nr:MAG: transglycosylase domain-containing protein [Anaerotruncus sp.]
MSLQGFTARKNRIWVNLEDMSPYMKNAFISIEDERFMKHHGVDWIRLVGVIVKRSNSGQGGSTITQQLIKNLTDEKRSYYRKKNLMKFFRHSISKKNYSKDEIIEAYLNTIYLSEGCYGVKTASEKYFGKDVSDLNAAECAAIASITQYPSKYDPLRHPENNRKRQLRVLDKMLENGALTQEEYNEAVNYEMVFHKQRKTIRAVRFRILKALQMKNKIDSYYVDYVIKSVIDDLQKDGLHREESKINALRRRLKNLHCG